MSWPVTINGNTYNESDFINYNHIVNFPRIVADVATVGDLADGASEDAKTAGGFTFLWDTGTADADPGTGKVRINNAALASATAMYISETTNAAQAIAAIIQSWDDSTSTIKGFLRIQKQADLAVYALYSISGSVVDGGSYDKLTLTYVAGNGSFAASDPVTVQFTRNGDKGDTGATGSAGIGFTREFMTSTGSSNAYVLTPASTLTSYQDGQVFIWEANHTSTGAATLNISGLGAKDIRKNFDQPIEANDIKVNFPVMVMYEASTDRFQVLNNIAQILTNPETRAWNRQIVYRDTVANTTSDSICIVFDTTTRLHNLKHKLYAGTLTFTLKKNGTAINFGASPSTSVNATTTQTTVEVNHSSLSYIDFSPGDRLEISITSASGASFLTIGLDTTENYS